MAVTAEMDGSAFDFGAFFWAPSFPFDEARDWADRDIILPCSAFLTDRETRGVVKIAQLGFDVRIYGSALWRPVLDRFGYHDVGSIIGADVDMVVSGLPNIFPLWQLEKEAGLKVLTVRPDKALILDQEENCRPLDITFVRGGFDKWSLTEAPNYLRSLTAEINPPGIARVVIPHQVCQPGDLFVTPSPEIVFSSDRPFGSSVRAALRTIGDAYRCGFNPPNRSLETISEVVRSRVEKVIESGKRLHFNTCYNLFALYASIMSEANRCFFADTVRHRLGIDQRLLRLSFQFQDVFFEEIWGERSGGFE